MEEVFLRLGVKIEMWAVSTTVALLFIIYMILEIEPPPSVRKTMQIIAGGLISTILVPGIAVDMLNIESKFYTGALTGLVVYSFPKVVSLLQGMMLSKINDKKNENT